MEFIDGEASQVSTSVASKADVDDAAKAGVPEEHKGDMPNIAGLSLEDKKTGTSNTVVRDFGGDTLETFQKYKILGAQASKLKSIFVNYVSVGNNIFSTTAVDEKIDFETKQAYFGRKFTILIERVSEFALDDLNKMKMEEHPFALSFINSIIKTQMRNSKLCQIGRNPRFFMPS